MLVLSSRSHAPGCAGGALDLRPGTAECAGVCMMALKSEDQAVHRDSAVRTQGQQSQVSRLAVSIILTRRGSIQGQGVVCGLGVQLG